MVLFNATEASQTKRAREDVIGRDFFRDVAPCGDVDAFRGRLDALRGSGEQSVTFELGIPFPWGQQTVHVRFCLVEGASWVFIHRE